MLKIYLCMHVHRKIFNIEKLCLFIKSEKELGITILIHKKSLEKLCKLLLQFFKVHQHQP